jgi:hypothetical protein
VTPKAAVGLVLLSPSCELFVVVVSFRDMLDQNPGGVVLSTDDYFSRHGDYRFDPSALGEAHEWNHKRCKRNRLQIVTKIE